MLKFVPAIATAAWVILGVPWIADITTDPPMWGHWGLALWIACWLGSFCAVGISAYCILFAEKRG